jgi:hypothetical protein
LKASFSTTAAALLALALLSSATAPSPAHGLVVVSDDAAGSATAPSDDPGWDRVGTVSGLTGIYLGSDWMLTAGHVGAGPVVLGGRSFAPVPDSTVRLRNDDGSSADLIVFRIQGAPDLPQIRIAKSTPKVGARILLIGHGRNRGAPTSWSGRAGFVWGTGSAMRWGTNVVFQRDLYAGTTKVFATQFRADGATPHEAQAAEGDSGGAAFVKLNRKWWLAGVLCAVGGFDTQPRETALYGNVTLIADLARYRGQLEKLLERPATRSPATATEDPPR